MYWEDICKKFTFIYIFAEAECLAPKSSVNGTTVLSMTGSSLQLEAALQFPLQEAAERQWPCEADARGMLG